MDMAWEKIYIVARRSRSIDDVSRYIAFPNCSSATGFITSVTSGEEEVGKQNLKLHVYRMSMVNFIMKHL
ncbi:hypothetical protein ACT7DB_01045 [Bacillus cereus]